MDFILHVAQDLPKLWRLQQRAMCLVLGSGGKTVFSVHFRPTVKTSRFSGELTQATRDIKSATWTLKGFLHRLLAEYSFKRNRPNSEFRNAAPHAAVARTSYSCMALYGMKQLKTAGYAQGETSDSEKPQR